MRRLLVILVLLLISVSVSSVAFAQDDPNACLTGGSMEGQCDLPTDAEDEWAWTCGYYVGLYDNGEISRDGIPDWCYYPDGSTGTLCSFYTDGTLGLDFALIGPLNTFENVAAHISTDGSCSGEIYGYATVVQAATEGEAEGLCQSLNPLSVGAIALPGLFGIPNLWGCALPMPS